MYYHYLSNTCTLVFRRQKDFLIASFFSKICLFIFSLINFLVPNGSARQNVDSGKVRCCARERHKRSGRKAEGARSPGRSSVRKTQRNRNEVSSKLELNLSHIPRVVDCLWVL